MFTQVLEITGVEPVSLADAKAWIRVYHTNEDAFLTSNLIPAVRSFMEKRLNVSLVEKKIRVVVEGAEKNFRLPQWPIDEIIDVEPDTLTLENGRLDNVAGANIDVTYQTDKYVTPEVHMAMLNLLAHWYVTRDLSSVPEAVEKVIKSNTRVLWFV